MRQQSPQSPQGGGDDTTQVGPQAELRAVNDQGEWRSAPLAARYELLGVIGSGGGGVVFRARDAVTGSLVAVKTASKVDGQVADLFEREARVLALLQHAAIVKYLDHGMSPNGAPFLVMELLAGENLRERLNQGPLEVTTACLLVARMLDALACAHDRGVVHRDFKPSNVFLPGGDLGQAKLLDFGVAREVHGWLRTLTGQVMGTPLYMAPEQALGKADLDGRADIFAAGCVLVECVTGKPVFSGPGAAGLAKLALADDVVPSCGLERLPEGVATLVRQMLAKEPDARPKNAATVAAQLRSLAEALEPTQQARTVATSLGAREARPVVVLMIGPAATNVDVASENERLSEIVTRWDGDAQLLISGACLITFGVGAARELAVRAARAALELRSAVVGRSMALALGRATVEGRVLVGAAIDETTRLVGMSGFASAPSVGSVFVDADAAELLTEQFQIQLHETDAGSAYELTGEVGVRTFSRLLMGKKVPFVGRDRELRGLEDLVAECFDEPRCGAALVLAPAGGGKSRLRRELLARLATTHSNLVTLMGTADAVRAGAPYEVLAAAFKQAAHIESAESAAVQSRKLEAFVFQSAPRLASGDKERITAFLGEMAGLPTPAHLQVLLQSARQDPRTMADQVRVAWLDWLAAALAGGSVLLVMEDLHWGDAPSIQLIEAAMKLYRSQPFVVVAFARPEVNTRFANLWRDLADRVTLPPLRARAARDLVKAVMPDLSEQRIDALVQRADGNPFFLEELVRAESANVGSRDAVTPPTVLAALQGRLDHVGDAAKRVLRAGAIFGEGFAADAVRALLPSESRGDVTEWLHVLANAELILPPDTRDKTGAAALVNERWQFRHALIRDAAYDTLTDADRRVGHKLAAAFLYEEGERDGVVLASHYERAGDTEQAVVQWRVAAEQALDANDLEGVADRCARADALGPQDEELGRLRLVASRAHAYKGDWPSGKVAAKEALPLLSGTEALEALCQLASSLFNLQQYEEAKATYARIYEQGALAGRTPAWAYAVLRTGSHHTRLGEANVVRSMLEDVRSIALSGDLRLEAMWYAVRSEILVAQGSSVLALQDMDRSIERLESIGDLQELCNLRSNRVMVLTDLGNLDAAVEEGNSLVALGQRVGHYIVPYAQANLACLALCQRDPSVAESYARKVLGSELARIDLRVAGFSQILLSQSALAKGEVASACEHAEKATELLSQAPSLLLSAEAALARSLLMAGNLKDACIYAASALATLRKLGAAEHAEFMIWLAAVECLAADGDRDEARNVAVESLAALEKRLALLERDDDRQRVLAAIPEAPLLAKQAQLLGVAFPKVPPTWSPTVIAKMGTGLIQGES